MTAIPDASPAVLPHLTAGLLLAARDHQCRLGLAKSSVEEIVEKTGASRSSSYEVRSRLLEVLPTLVRPVGRPPPPSAPPPPETDAICHEALRFVMSHPGCVHGGPERRQYSDSFRRLVLDLHERHPGLSTEMLARAIEVPADTLRDWLRVRTAAEPAPATAGPASLDSEPARKGADPLHIETVLGAWKTWEGDVTSFCEHVRHHLRVPLGRTAICSILEALDARRPQRRPGRSPDETALRKSFQTFFPGAQWLGDGTPVAVTLLGERFTFNFELLVDAFSAAFTGASIRDAEDSAALIEAMADGELTTGDSPLALLVDNRPSNLTAEVEQALDGKSLLIRATPARPQTKGHVEGAFGLFFQTLPALVLSAKNNRELAREILRLVVTTWGRTLNGRARTNRSGKSRIELYAEKPTPEQIGRARAALEERLRRQKAALQTQKARLDPVVNQVLTAAFSRFAFADPDGQLLRAIARYPIHPVLDGIAIFDSKRAAGSLPPSADARYLLGIVRNVSQQREAELISENMLRLRLEARDLLFGPLAQRQSTLQVENPEAPRLIINYVDEAIAAQRYIDRLFWLCAAGDLLAAAPEPARPDLYRLGARRFNTTSRMSYGDRLKAVRFLADKAFPLE